MSIIRNQLTSDNKHFSKESSWGDSVEVHLSYCSRFKSLFWLKKKLRAFWPIFANHMVFSVSFGRNESNAVLVKDGPIVLIFNLFFWNYYNVTFKLSEEILDYFWFFLKRTLNSKRVSLSLSSNVKLKFQASIFSCSVDHKIYLSI